MLCLNRIAKPHSRLCFIPRSRRARAGGPAKLSLKPPAIPLSLFHIPPTRTAKREECRAGKNVRDEGVRWSRLEGSTAFIYSLPSKCLLEFPCPCILHLLVCSISSRFSPDSLCIRLQYIHTLVTKTILPKTKVVRPPCIPHSRS